MLKPAHGLFGWLIFTLAQAQPLQAASLEDSVASPHRTPAYANRDQYRNPVATLKFFEVEPAHTVVEIWPGTGGWYAEILAHYLKDEGRYIGAHFSAQSERQFHIDSRKKFAEKFSDPALYGKIEITGFHGREGETIAPANAADRVLTFRNVHNWLSAGNEKAFFKAFYDALKPGGILGVVEHEAAPGTSLEQMKESGYVTKALTIELAEEAGFKFVGESEVNANPKDTKDHAAGVWTLPPTLRLGPYEEFIAIGESDRMTLKFVKP